MKFILDVKNMHKKVYEPELDEPILSSVMVHLMPIVNLKYVNPRTMIHIFVNLIENSHIFYF
jgi:hypothetical protein